MKEQIPKIALLKKALESADINLKTAKQILKELSGDEKFNTQVKEHLKNFPRTASAAQEAGEIVEGIFNGEVMIDKDGQKYPVPANYASKSKLIEGDQLKLTISNTGAFLYKQIGPIPRKMIRGVLMEEEGEYYALAEDKKYHLILASVTYFKAKTGDKVTIIVPEDKDSDFAAIENVIFQSEDGGDNFGEDGDKG